MPDKFDRLDALNDEVRAFHPFLLKVLQRFPAIKHVEYNHGPNEKGADFVLTKTDETFGLPTYIGVIAKTGPISKSEVYKIEEQIRDCDLGRYTRSGKQRIRLDEIWVMTNSTISHQAQEVIEKNFATSKIQFVNRDLLISVIDHNFPSFWHEVPIEVGDYFTDLQTELRRLEQESLIVPLADDAFYIEQSIYYEPPAPTRKDWKREKPVRVDFKEQITNHDLILIQADAGVGKSKLLRQTAHELCLPESHNVSRLIPLYGTVRELENAFSLDIEKFAKSRLGMNFSILEDPEMKAVLLLDGLDELNKEPEELAKFTESLLIAVQKFGKAKLVVSSRPLPDVYSRSECAKKFRTLQISPLSNKQVLSFLSHLCKGITSQKRIHEDLKNSPIFKELPKSPIAAILLADIINQEVEELPMTLPELYLKYFELMLGRWEIKKGLRSTKEYEALDNILMNLACYFMENQLDLISYDEALENFFREYLKYRNLEIDAEFLLKKASARCDIIHVDKDSNSFKFKHRTFIEFLYAKKKTREDALPIGNKIFELYWLNSFYFYAGIKRDCPEILRQVINLSPKGDLASWTKIESLANLFLAAYTTPYDVISDGVKTAALEAAELCEAVIHLRSTSPLTSLPEMPFLYILQYMFKERYGYTFLNKAIIDAAIDIAGGKESDERKAYALFLLNVAHIRAEGRESFEYVLKPLADKLPLNIQFAIVCESKGFTSRNPLVKKHDQKIRKSLKGNKSLQSLLDDMFEKPMVMRAKKLKSK